MSFVRSARRPALLAAATVLATALAAASAVVIAPTGASAAGSTPSGTRSLAAVLTSDTGGFDRNSRDFDILTRAVLTVLDAKPDSAVGVLTDGSVALTAFIPTDGAFRQLVRDITDARWLPSERRAFDAVAGLGVDTVESVLLYHVVPGATIDSRTALRSDGAKLTTALGATIEVDVRRWGHGCARLRLIDADRDDRDPRGAAFDINRGNRQIAHAIDRVLRPIDLP
ncbi:MAG TPA: fasciclin domain-containing protein [Micromonosporaceae bacterium]|nr:fasciclin domain-containing protein [Micromonosporaceae bacterium]